MEKRSPSFPPRPVRKATIRRAIPLSSNATSISRPRRTVRQDGGEAKDVLYAVDAAIRRNSWIDPQRLGIEGGSYGGQLTNWLITQSDRFKAAIPSAGISNLITFNYMAYYHDYLAVEFGAFPHQ